MDTEYIDNVANQLGFPILGNELSEWIVAIGILLVGMVVTVLLKWLVLNRLDAIARRLKLTFVDAINAALQQTYIVILFFPLTLFAANWLELPKGAAKGLYVFATIAFFLQLGIWFSAAAAKVIQHSRQHALETNAAAATSLAAVSFLSRLVIWAIILLLTLDNIGIDVTALVAGLGVGGVAVALAVQNILGDLFASLSIIIDKPFEIGDFIVVGDYMGVVANIGLKTTRISSLGGEQIVFSNSDLLSARVRNYKRMEQRRVVFSFGVLYQTSADQLAQIPEIVRSIIDGLETTQFDRAHFFKFGNSSLDFEVVYYVKSADYNVYMDAQQQINLALVRQFAEHNIVFAYPTRSLYLEAPVPVSFEPPIPQPPAPNKPLAE
ncbi:mechanosensitive ion channel family protein [Shewanella avicenniae]|uniref:Mechanosensitive ion channel family protein n=1 Tax=Shewanella avicenniae TaxID=2814294 RepID=A0ABX7QN38_9GAMM|nr:mechanosensitive ion channel family protein [Shewanella avicenniae]QSX32310.1 mechanosensitive ion channel family protein [Shewanella avicenniae]